MSAAAAANPATKATRSAGGLREAGAGRFILEGAVTVANVTGLRAAGLEAFARGKDAIEVDLSGVSRADSGALALLVDWLAWARSAHRSLKYTAPPAALLALARLSDVEELLLGTAS